MSINNWLEEYKLKEDADKKVIADVTNEINKLLKGVDRVSCIPQILANVFETIEGTTKKDGVQGFNNHIINWGIETFAGRKIAIVSRNLLAVYEYCVNKEYTQDNKWEWGGGDRQIFYIPNETKKVLHFENQNIKFVVVISGYDVHVREVYTSILDDNDNNNYFYSFKEKGFDSTVELREGLKTEKGLEIAICNLTGKQDRFANSVEGNQYPDKIDLATMIKSNFDKPCKAFEYGDNRDSGYLMSINNLITTMKCELLNISRADYAFHDMREVVNSIPKSFMKKYKRDNSIDIILG